MQITNILMPINQTRFLVSIETKKMAEIIHGYITMQPWEAVERLLKGDGLQVITSGGRIRHVLFASDQWRVSNGEASACNWAELFSIEIDNNEINLAALSTAREAKFDELHKRLS